MNRLPLFFAKVEFTDACWLWTASTDWYGYGWFWVGAPRRAHRVCYEWLVGPIPAGLELDHLCRVPACVRPEHLEPVTHAENVRRGDLGKIQREWSGERHPCSTISDSKALSIYFSTGKQRDIAKRFGVAQGSVGAIKREEHKGIQRLLGVTS